MTSAQIETASRSASSGIRDLVSGLAGKLLSLAIVPLLIIAGLAVFNLVQISSLFNDTLEDSEKVAVAQSKLTEANLKINGDMLSLVNGFGTFMSLHQRSLLTKNAALNGPVLKARSEADRRLKSFQSSVEQLSGQLQSSGFLVPKDESAIGVDSLKAKSRIRLTIVSRVTNTLPRLFELLQGSNDRTIGLIKDGKFQTANANFLFEENARNLAVNKALQKIRGNLTELIGFVSVQQNGQRAANNAAAVDSLDTNSNTTYTILGILVVALVLVAGFFSIRVLVRPLHRMTETMRVLADGDNEIEIPYTGRKDEIGLMASAVQIFKDNALERVRLEAEAEQQRQRAEDAKRREEEQEREKQEREAVAERQRQEAEAEQKRLEAESELERQKAAEQEEQARTEAERAAKIDELTARFEQGVTRVLDSVGAAVGNLEQTAVTLNTTADNTTSQATTVSAAAEQASANVQTVASAAEELSASISEISSQVNQSSSISQSAVEEANKTNEQVKGLAEAASKIGEVVELINDIASQTNLLALNATIEAARAGEAGKGFAVVASEVGNLASQTAKATEEIGAQIAGIQSATNESVQAIEGITMTIGELNEIATTIASAVEEQGASTQEIARNVEQAATGTQEVTSTISAVATAANDTAAASTDLNSAVDTLGSESTTLRSEVESFLKEIQAA